MALPSIPVILAMSVGSAAVVGGGIYTYQTYYKPTPETEKPQVQALVSEPKISDEKSRSLKITKSEPKKEAEKVLPKFQLLRVEKDGSAVMAGTAIANSTVEIVDAAGNVIATTKAGSTGDFAIVLDKPLEPGAHELFIRTTPGKGEALLSAEAGVINIPEKGGELIAMVSEPGKATKLIQKPDAEKSEPTDKVENKLLAEKKAMEVAKLEPKVKDQPEVKVKAEPKVQAKEQPKVQATEEPKPEVKEEVKVEEKPVVKAKPKIVKPVLVQAVDVEDGKVFVAGTGEPGREVLIYMDNTLLGKAVVGPTGHFLVESKHDLVEGEHTVRADMLQEQNTSVAARAEVPLLHEVDKPVKETVIAQAKPEVKPAEEPETLKMAKVEPEPQTKQPMQSRSLIQSEKPEAKMDKPAKVETVAVEPKPMAKVEETKVAKAEPKLEKVRRILRTGSSVIIRSGDNLWRVSRRILGRGIRYSTIYDANKDQISDPNLIFPGQIFDLPKQANKEELSQSQG